MSNDSTFARFSATPHLQNPRAVSYSYPPTVSNDFTFDGFGATPWWQNPGTVYSRPPTVSTLDGSAPTLPLGNPGMACYSQAPTMSNGSAIDDFAAAPHWHSHCGPTRCDPSLFISDTSSAQAWDWWLPENCIHNNEVSESNMRH